MTRKHFEFMADFIRTYPHPGAAARVSLSHALADMFEERNARFDRGRFLRACGIYDPEPEGCADALAAYRNYVEGNLERIERGGWTPLCFAEFCESEERNTYQEGAT